MTCKAIDPKDAGDGATHWSVDNDDPRVCRTFAVLWRNCHKRFSDRRPSDSERSQ